MSKIAHAIGVAALLGARLAAAQSTAAYRARLDSLARQWRPLAAVETRATQNRSTDLPPLAFHVGILEVRTDSEHLAIARAAAERLEPMIAHAYGASAARLAAYTFVVQSAGTTVLTGVADSANHIVIRGGVFPTTDALVDAWNGRATAMFFGTLDPSLRDWVGGPLPLEPLRRADWNDARIRLLLEGSKATRECANGDIRRCEQSLGLSPVDDPLDTLYAAPERIAIIESYMTILRRADPVKFDRCMQTHESAPCDTLGELIPSDAIPLPATAAVRQEFVRFALEQGGEGAVDRFLQPGSNRERIERAARESADTVVARWQARVSDLHSMSTSLDATTAVSSLMWAAACAGLALRSSRWR